MGPAWDGEKGSYKEWQWEAQAWLQMLGRGHCLGYPAPAWLGLIQDPPTEQQTAWMRQDTRDVFVLTFRLISDKSSAGITCRLEIRSDFGNDLDGKGLWEWLDLRNSRQTRVAILKLKADINGAKLGAAEPATAWALKMQQILRKYLEIPEAKRGGDMTDLIEQLLDKVPHQEYVEKIRAQALATPGILTDFQLVAQNLADLQEEKLYKSRPANPVITQTGKPPRALVATSAPARSGSRATGGTPLSEVRCHRCKQKGHLKRDCPLKYAKCGLGYCGGARDLARAQLSPRPECPMPTPWRRCNALSTESAKAK